MTADPGRSGGELDELVVDYLERVKTEGNGALDALCAEHPDLAGQLRSAVQLLDDHGLGGTGSPAAPPLPDELDGFAILREVGRGGMGVVYEARELALDRRVAIKVLLAHLTHDERTIERFRREGLTIGALQHPGIVKIHAVGSAGGDRGHHYLAMEFIEGASLDRVLRAARDLGLERLSGDALRAAIAGERHRVAGEPIADRPPSAVSSRVGGRGHIGFVVDLVARVADALQHSHDAGVVHRDVKPSNILVRPDGTPVLTDFGLAWRDDLPGLTRSGAMAGTPAYMAPEQTTFGGAIDARTDVFSLGATLYELLTLQRPFPGESTHELMQSIQQQDPVDPQKLNGSVPADLAAVVLKALEKEPRRRYPSAAAFAADLRAFLEFRPVAARRASALERARRWAVRQPLRAALVAVIALAVPTVTGLAGYLIANQDLVDIGEQTARRQRVDAAIDQAYVQGFGAAVRGEAMSNLEIALALEPDNVEAVAGMAIQLLDPGDQQPTPEHGQAALAFLDGRGEMVARERVLQRMRAWCLQALAQDDEAAAELERLGEPQTALEAFWAGMWLMSFRNMWTDSTDDQRRALGYLKDAVALAPRPRVAYHYYLAAAAGQLRKEDEARRAARSLTALWPDAAYAWAGAGVALYEVRPEESVHAYRRALELKDTPEWHSNLANALSRLGRSDEAIAEWQLALELKPDHLLAHYNMGREFFARRGDQESSVPHLRRAVEIEPTLLGAQHYLIWALGRLERGEEALTAALAAREALPDEPILLRDIANIHADAGRTEKAAEAAQQAIDLDPADRRSYQQLAELRAAQGDLDGARQALEKAVEVVHEDDRPTSLEMLAWFLLGQPQGHAPIDSERGLRIAEELVEDSHGEQPWFVELLGFAQLTTGADEAALVTFQRAMTISKTVETASRKNLERRLEQRIDKLEKELASR